MSAYIMIATILATQLADAMSRDAFGYFGKHVSGRFGKHVSDWIYTVAKELDDRAAEVAYLKSKTNNSRSK